MLTAMPLTRYCYLHNHNKDNLMMSQYQSRSQLFNHLHKLPRPLVHDIRAPSLPLTSSYELLQSHTLSLHLLPADVLVLVALEDHLLGLRLVGPQPHPDLLENLLPTALVAPVPDVLGQLHRRLHEGGTVGDQPLGLLGQLQQVLEVVLGRALGVELEDEREGLDEVGVDVLRQQLKRLLRQLLVVDPVLDRLPVHLQLLLGQQQFQHQVVAGLAAYLVKLAVQVEAVDSNGDLLQFVDVLQQHEEVLEPRLHELLYVRLYGLVLDLTAADFLPEGAETGLVLQHGRAQGGEEGRVDARVEDQRYLLLVELGADHLPDQVQVLGQTGELQEEWLLRVGGLLETEVDLVDEFGQQVALEVGQVQELLPHLRLDLIQIVLRLLEHLLPVEVGQLLPPLLLAQPPLALPRRVETPSLLSLIRSRFVLLGLRGDAVPAQPSSLQRQTHSTLALFGPAHRLGLHAPPDNLPGHGLLDYLALLLATLVQLLDRLLEHVLQTDLVAAVAVDAHPAPRKLLQRVFLLEAPLALRVEKVAVEQSLLNAHQSLPPLLVGLRLAYEYPQSLQLLEDDLELVVIQRFHLLQHLIDLLELVRQQPPLMFQQLRPAFALALGLCVVLVVAQFEEVGQSGLYREQPVDPLLEFALVEGQEDGLGGVGQVGEDSVEEGLDVVDLVDHLRLVEGGPCRCQFELGSAVGHLAQHLPLHPLQRLLQPHYLPLGHGGNKMRPQHGGDQAMSQPVDLPPQLLQRGELGVAVVPGVLDQLVDPRPAQRYQVLPDELSAELLYLAGIGPARPELVERAAVPQQSLHGRVIDDEVAVLGHQRKVLVEDGHLGKQQLPDAPQETAVLPLPAHDILPLLYEHCQL